MPEVIIELAEGRTIDQKRTIVREITDTISRVCEVDPQNVVVIIHENPRTDKAKGGVLFSRRAFRVALAGSVRLVSTRSPDCRRAQAITRSATSSANRSSSSAET
jgi:4-oxalocrotonate tautomerase